VFIMKWHGRLLACSMILVGLILVPSFVGGATTLAQDGELALEEVRVTASPDDAEERADGSVGRGSTDLELVFDQGGNQTVGMRFNGVDIPPEASITSAYIQFQVDETSSDLTSLTIRGEDVDNAARFTTATRNISSRPRTTAAVSWSPAPWLTAGEAGPDQQTPDIASVIQEVVNRPGWSSGNSLVIIITGSGERVAESYNGDPAAAPLLHVEFNTSSNVVPSTTVLVGAGDIAGCGSQKDLETARLLDNIAGTVFTLGDNVYSDGTDLQFSNCYDPTWGRYKARTRPAPGNHDYHTPGASGYFDYFGSAAGEMGKGYYSYDLGAWHIIVLNSECTQVGGCESDSPQGQWLEADLAANPKVCTLAYWHRPRFSSGSVHGSNARYRDFWRLLYDAGADVVLNGHDHTYERFAPQDPAGIADPGRGIREFVVGTGGAGLYTFGTPEPNSEVREGNTHGVLKLTLHPTSYDWEFVPIAGQTFTDSGSASCVLSPLANVPPTVNVGPDQTITLPKSATLDGTVTDDGLPNPSGTVTTTWSVVSGPGTVTFGEASAEDTTASFSMAGVYVLRLTADDSELDNSDEVTIAVNPAGGASITEEVRVTASPDDAEERADSNVGRGSTDLELVFDQGGNQTVGMRFNGVDIPPGANITSAYIQFQVDETSSDLTSLTIRGEDVDNAAIFTTATRNISSRPRTTAAVSWSPAPWSTVGEAGPDQQTPDIASVIQEVVNRPGWSSGNSLVIIITGSGERVAESYNGDPAAAPLLHVDYNAGS
jgi:hypothetical protein